MGPNIHTLFVEVAGLPVVGHTWRRFDGAESIDEIVLVVREGMQDAFEELGRRIQPRKPFRLALGGRERQDSVWNGLLAISPGVEMVAIQDGARPCSTADLITATFAAARQSGAAVAAQRVTDTIKDSDDGATISRHLDRARLWAVQTPQTFRVDVIRRALEAARARGLNLTDDTAACDLIGQPVRLVESGAPNPKATLPGDFAFIEGLLR